MAVVLGCVVGLAPGAAASPAERGWSPLTVLQEAHNVQVVDLTSTSNGNTVVSWAGGIDGRYRTFFAVRRGRALFGPPREMLPGRITTFVTHGAEVTVGSVRNDDFLLRTLRRDASWGPVRTIAPVPVQPGSSTYQLVGNAVGDLAVWWFAADGSTRLVVRRNGTWQQPQRVPIGNGYPESITMDRTGGVDVVYSPRRNEVAAAVLRHVRRAPSGAWGAPKTLARGSLTAFTVAANDAGALAVSWLARREGFTYSLRLRYRPAGGS